MTCKAHPKVSAAGAGDGMNMPSRSGRQRSLPLRHWGLAKRVPGTWGQVSRRTGASQRDRPALGVLRGLEGSGISLMARAAHPGQCD